MDPLRVLLISPFFPPQPSVASHRAHSFARAWADRGDTVTVLTTAKRMDQIGLNLPIGGVELVEVGTAAPGFLDRARSVGRSTGRQATGAAARGYGGLRRMPRALKSRTGIFSAVRKPDLTDWWVEPAVKWCVRAHRDWDVALSCGGPYTAHLVANALKKRRIVRHWVADYRDLWTAHPLYRGLFPFTMRERALERAVMEQVDVATTVSAGLATRLRTQTARPVHIIFNGYDEQAITELPPERILPRDDTTRLVYTGSFYPRGQDASPLLRAMSYLHHNRPDVARRLQLIVAGSDAAEWARLADRHGVLPMLDLRGSVPWRDSLRLQRDADALVLFDWRDSRHGVLTGKLFEYLASVPPILVVGGPADSPVAEIVRRAGRGVALGTDTDAIRHSVESIMADQALATGVRQAEFIARFTRQNQAARMRHVIGETVG